MSKSVDGNPSLESLSIESPSPLYARVKQVIVQKIRSGAWLPNSKLPSESELLSLLGVSRMTINRALRELTIEGLLVRMQGVGTFVAEPKGHAALFEIHNIAEEISARGHVHRCEVIMLEEVPAKVTRWRCRLPWKGSTRLFHSLVVHYENEVPVQIEERFVNARLRLNTCSRTSPKSRLMPISCSWRH